ncbi:MAG: OmpA family protein [Castellaniella sp.]|uniref:OmpA family protein n=1 Tax=Castellaniella sp. TaxID=1955812 RepID=UPI002A35974D|nr:OmpA family protein [Castellaniella sp.]MDY0308955.1 OmpA family protein [Castellaniella sp.]
MRRDGSAELNPAQAFAQRMRAMEAELRQARQALRRDRKRAGGADRWGLGQTATESLHEEGWFMTYLDMMTLLLVAMIVMLAFSGSIGKRMAVPAAPADASPAVAQAPIPVPDDIVPYSAEDAALAFNDPPPDEPERSPLFGTFPDFEPQPAPAGMTAPDGDGAPAMLAQIPPPDDIAPYSAEDAALAFNAPPASGQADQDQAAGNSQAAGTAVDAPSEGAALAASLPLGELGHDVEVIVNQRSISFRINSEILFDTGQADLSREGLAVLQRMAKVLSDAGYDITVEGHTDAVPVRSNARYPSNWELSSARAGSVVRYLQANGIDKGRLKAVGYADARPIADNRSVDGRARNRRVELVVEKPPAAPDTHVGPGAP